MPPLFLKFFIKAGRPGRSETGRPAGQPAEILKFTGLVEKILTGSISDLPACKKAEILPLTIALIANYTVSLIMVLFW